MNHPTRRLFALALLFTGALGLSSAALARDDSPTESALPSSRATLERVGSATWAEIVERDARSRVPAGLAEPEPRVVKRPALPDPEIPAGLLRSHASPPAPAAGSDSSASVPPGATLLAGTLAPRSRPVPASSRFPTPTPTSRRTPAEPPGRRISWRR
ncbi:MAG: hypothetical protein ACKPBU_15225 [Alphaproteobacteria bacterium]